MQFACNDHDLAKHFGHDRLRARAELACRVRKGLNSLPSHVSTASCDMFCYCTHGEIDYLESLNGIPTSTRDECLGMGFVARDALVWIKAQVHMDFRYFHKSAFIDVCNK